MKDTHTNTLDGAAGFERCRADYKRYADPLQPTRRELEEEERYYQMLKDEPQEEETENEPA
jgi:hypothetical protein